MTIDVGSWRIWSRRQHHDVIVCHWLHEVMRQAFLKQSVVEIYINWLWYVTPFCDRPQCEAERNGVQVDRPQENFCCKVAADE